MIKLHEKYVISSHGKKVNVILPIAEFQKLLAELEELEAVRAYDKAKAFHDEAIPFEQTGSFGNQTPEMNHHAFILRRAGCL